MNKTTSTLRYLGGVHVLHHEGEPDVYNGRDAETGDTFTLTVGGNDEIEVSIAVAVEISETFPGCFQVDGDTIGKRSGKKKTARTSDDDNGDGEDDLAGQLLAHTRNDLNAAAGQLGIEDAEQLPNKAAVVAAIVAAKKGNDEE